MMVFGGVDTIIVAVRLPVAPAAETFSVRLWHDATPPPQKTPSPKIAAPVPYTVNVVFKSAVLPAPAAAPRWPAMF